MTDYYHWGLVIGSTVPGLATGLLPFHQLEASASVRLELCQYTVGSTCKPAKKQFDLPQPEMVSHVITYTYNLILV